MPHTPPINLRELEKKGVLDEETFFRLLSEQCNYVTPEMVKSFYMGLVRHMTSELRKNGVVRMPHLGDFALVKQKDKTGWAGQYQAFLTGKYMVKFYIKDTWKKYFSKLSETPGRDGKLDPREKVLNRDL